jgi:hypothetical protein
MYSTDNLWQCYRFLKEVELLKSKVKQLEPCELADKLLLEIELLLSRDVESFLAISTQSQKTVAFETGKSSRNSRHQSSTSKTSLEEYEEMFGESEGLLG